MTEQNRVGIDLGGTKIEGITMNPAGEIVQRLRVPTPQGDYDGILNTVNELVTQLANHADQPVGICTPGAISPTTGLMRNSNSVCLNGRRFHDDLATHLGRAVKIANDADCFALSEATDGAAAGSTSVFGVILGTGVGGGIVIDGHLHRGPNAIAGEWGHNSLPRPTADELNIPPCYCGRVGCIESFLSGPALKADGDSVEAFARYEDRLARALSSVINILDPEVIVLGGGLSSIERLYTNVPLLWDRYVFSDHVATRIVAPKFGDSSGVRGAAWLV